MRYIVVDLEGASRLTFTDVPALVAWHAELDADIGCELLVEQYDAAGRRQGAMRWLDEFVESASRSWSRIGRTGE